MTKISYAEAVTKVKAQVTASKSSFHAGMAVLPKARREGMYALYGFCRVIDDIADDSPSPEIAARELQKWRGFIADAFRGKANDAITTALLPAIRSFNLVEKDFQEIIDGMEMDSGAVSVAGSPQGGHTAEQSRPNVKYAIIAPDMATLDLYCDRVASAVGRASVRIFGNVGADAMQVAHHLGRALQLTNILRDLAEDAARGRLYLPRELLAKHGILSRDPQSVLRDAKLPDVCRDLAAVARDHYVLAELFMKKCPATAMRPARIMRTYYKAIFDRLIELNWADPSKRVSLPKWQKIGLMLKGFFG